MAGGSKTKGANGVQPAGAAAQGNGHGNSGNSKKNAQKVAAPVPAPAPEVDEEEDEDQVEQQVEESNVEKKKKKKNKKKKKPVVEEAEVDEEDDVATSAAAAVDEDDDDESSAAPSAASSTSPSSLSAARRGRSSFDPADFVIRKTKSTYDTSAYPESAPGQNPHPKVPFFTAISTYFAYGLLIAVGHCRDFLNRWGWLRTHHSDTSRMAPLVSDFDDFYTRRLYHRIESAWNRPIASCPASVMKLLYRERDAYGTPLTLSGESKNVLNLGSYNYLGFGDPNSPTKPEVFQALDQFSVCTTSTRTNLGTTVLHKELETLVAHFVGKEAAMIFGMGFATNSTGIPALVGKGGLIISDANNHSSIACGARSSGAVIRVFKHNDIRSLEAVIRHAIIHGQPKSHRPWTKILIIIEGIYSMEGEICPLKEIVALKKKYGCYLFVDEAHSIGAIGENGRGICEYSKVDPSEVDILMGTFTKSFGAVGGYIAANKDVVDFLRANSAGSVYSCSISPPAVQQVLSAFKIMLHADGTDIGRKKLDALRENSNYFRSRLIEMGCHVLGDWDSPIVLLMLYHPAKIQSFSAECLKRGLAIVVVGFPATPLLLARVRFCLSAGHTREQLDYALMQIEDVADLMGVKYSKYQV